jgi:hypothetical protein
MNLFEYLSEPVDEGIWSLDVADRTYITKSDPETSDDSPGLGLGIPTSVLDSTRKTADDHDTYDDGPGIALGVPVSLLEATRFTREDKETVDDDPGLSSLSIPQFG